MARILVTGSTDGLGRATADRLLRDGHHVLVHARSTERGAVVTDLVDRGADLVVADLADRQQVLRLGRELDAGDPIDAVVHNAGVFSGPSLMPVNVVAPYLLTALLQHPTRHVYLSSGMHRGGRARLDDVDWDGTTETNTYSDTKLFVTALAREVAERWPGVRSNAVDPGWVPTKMGGAGAPDDLELGHRTQERLATASDADVSGGYWFHDAQQTPHHAVADPAFRTRLVQALEAATGVALPTR